MFDISPCEEVGDFEVKAKLLGVEMEKVQLHFQVKLFHQRDMGVLTLQGQDTRLVTTR